MDLVGRSNWDGCVLGRIFVTNALVPVDTHLKQQGSSGFELLLVAG